MSSLIFLLSSLFLISHQVLGDCELQKVFPDLNFLPNPSNLKFPCESTKNIYLSTKRYIPKHVILTRAQIHQNNLYACLPRLKTGVPFSLGRIPLKKGECTPTIEPYPCWSIQEEGNCQAIQTCVDLVHDAKEILWVLDTGDTNTLEQPIHRCDAKIWGICTKTNKVVKVINISDLITEDSRLQHLIVTYDENGRCYM